jgi:hypothetical protein
VADVVSHAFHAGRHPVSRRSQWRRPHCLYRSSLPANHSRVERSPLSHTAIQAEMVGWTGLPIMPVLSSAFPGNLAGLTGSAFRILFADGQPPAGIT